MTREPRDTDLVIPISRLSRLCSAAGVERRTQAFNKFNQLEEREWHIKPLKNNVNKQLRILLDA
jgi:hypothetical protein